MSEELNLDTLNKEELKAQAGILGIELKGNPSDDTIREKIREALGEPTAKPAVSEDSGIAVRKDEKRYTIKIHKDGKDKQPVPLACNGRVVRIKRGETVTIGEGLFESLKNAVQMVKDEDSEEMIEVPSYPYTVLSTE
ncbi:hypothetical protein GCM10027040_27640 [Halomonas shantousis]